MTALLLMCRKITLRSRCLRQRRLPQKSPPRLMVEMRTEYGAKYLYNILVQKWNQHITVKPQALSRTKQMTAPSCSLMHDICAGLVLLCA